MKSHKYTNYLNKKQTQLNCLLNSEKIDTKQIRTLCWGGIPPELRNQCYRILLDCMPTNSNDLEEFDKELLKEYKRYKSKYKPDPQIEKQITIDIKRLGPNGFTTENPEQISVQKSSYINILKLYSFAEPTVLYVQGMADILVPIFVNLFQIDNIETSEAIIYFVFSNLMDSFKENMIGQQHGSELLVYKMLAIIKSTDPELFKHILKHKLDLRMCCFRWFNTVFTREFDGDILLVVWDTMLCSEDFNKFLVHLGAAVIVKFRDIILANQLAEENVMFLQNLKIVKWDLGELLLLFSNVYVSANSP